MKKFLTLFIILLLTPFFIFAKNDNNNLANPLNGKAVFFSKNGDVTPLDVKVNYTLQSNSVLFKDKNLSVEFETILPNNLLNSYSGSISGDNMDAYVKAWARLNYNHNGGKYLVTSVEGNWRAYNDLDRHVEMRNTHCLVACNSSPDGGPTDQLVDVGVGIPFVYNTWFSRFADSNDFFVAIGTNTFVDVYNMSSFRGTLMLHLPIKLSSGVDMTSFTER